MCRNTDIHVTERTIISFTLFYMYISVSTPLYSSLCVTCRSVYLQCSKFHSVLHVDQCVCTVLSLTLCCIYICVSMSFYSSQCLTCRSVYLHHSILHSVLYVDQPICINQNFFIATCRAVYLHRSILHYTDIHVKQSEGYNGVDTLMYI
jgi:hypothetical protein